MMCNISPAKGLQKAIILACATCVAILLSGANAKAQTSLFDNFNTENGGVGVLNYTGFVHWDVESGAVDLIGNGFFDFLPGNGLYVDLDGSQGAGGTLKSKNAVVPGFTYTFSFRLAGSQGGSTETVEVSIGNAYFESFVVPSSQNFTTILRTVTVSNTGEFIRFRNLGNDNIGALLDDVSLEVVPEPASMIVVGSGLVGLLGLRRRKQA